MGEILPNGDIQGYSRKCSACGATINGCNMYGMGTCRNCGFHDNPVQNDNRERARQWRLTHRELFPGKKTEEDPVSIDIGILCNQISQGDFDPHLKAIQESITGRINARQKEVLALVQEVHGPNATITITR